MTEKSAAPSFLGAAGNLVVPLIVAGVVGAFAYYGTSSSIDAEVNTRLTNIEEDIELLREAQKDESKARVAKLEAQVLILESQLRELREKDRDQ